MIASILASVGLPILLSVFKDSLKHLNHPVADTAVKALEQVDIVIKSGEIPPQKQAEAHRHLEAIAEMEMRQLEVTISEINASLRAEIASSDSYVRRMRPTFGYIMAFTWAAQMFGLAYIMVFETERSSIIIEAMESLGTIWAVGLSVLGIYVYKRSKDKEILQIK